MALIAFYPTGIAAEQVSGRWIRAAKHHFIQNLGFVGCIQQTESEIITRAGLAGVDKQQFLSRAQPAEEEAVSLLQNPGFFQQAVLKGK